MVKFLLERFRADAVCLLFIAASSLSGATIGAEIAWTTVEAEDMKVRGAVVVGPSYQPHQAESESSKQRYVRLETADDFVECSAPGSFDAMVVRYSVPDGKEGGGMATSLRVLVNDRPVRTITVNSRNSWLYGTYPFSNDPGKGKPRNFYDEARLKDLIIHAGDRVRLQKDVDDGVTCSIDFLDFERMPSAVPPPVGAISIEEFGGSGIDPGDDTLALRACIVEAKTSGRVVWVPAGEYLITGDVVVPSSVRIQGAGMWHTTFKGDPELYGQAERRVRFKLVGEKVRIADFSIVGHLNYRNDSEANDGVVVSGCTNAEIVRIWVEHTKAGVWAYNGRQLSIEGCRFRNLIADGVNLCVGTTDSVVQNCTARGTGDDCFAIWPVPADQGHENADKPGNNVIRRSTGQLTFLANGGALYGGMNNRIEECLFTDIGTGCGILISTTFPTADASRGIDNNFDGHTTVKDCQLVRCGGYDHSWGWRGALQICMDGRSISGLRILRVEIRDSFSDGLTIVGPQRENTDGALADSVLEEVLIQGSGLGASDRSDLWVRSDASGELKAVRSELGRLKNDSVAFELTKTDG